MATTTLQKPIETPKSKTGGKTPRQLSVPTDLGAKASQEISDAINPLIADAFALYIKTKNYHWHLASSHFRDYHLMFDEHAEQIFATIDVLAERVRKIGGTTIRSVGHVASLQTVKDNDEEFVTPFDMISDLIEENKNMAANMRKAHDVCDDNKDVATASFLEVFIDETERRTWFLYEAAQRDAD
ncbi:MAG: DNA starvation/stationary phase protection protein [Capsulimonas sp.]|uniref:Dps family protein n=1 Tax=Capsulimonas sp. TaxID=2494211 RepID=UPI003265F4F1